MVAPLAWTMAGLFAAALVIVLTLIFASGCKEGDTVVNLPPETGCPFTLDATPVSGFPGLYAVVAVPSGPFRLRIGATTRSVEFSTLIEAEPGDTISACRECGCTEPIELR